MMSLFLKT